MTPDPRAQAVARDDARGPFRLAELIGGLTLAADLVNGFPPEKVLRTVVLAVEVGRRAGFDDATLRDAYYVTLFASSAAPASRTKRAPRSGPVTTSPCATRWPWPT